MPADAEASPWLSLYDDGLQPGLVREHGSALAMFRAALERGPERDLIRYFDTPISIGSVDRLSDGLAAAMAELGAGPGERVGLYLQNGPAFVIGLVAIWKLGAIAVPCNPMLRRRELAVQLADCRAVGLLALESLYLEVASAALGATEVRFAITVSELDLLEGETPAPLAAARRERPPEAHDLLELAEAHADADLADVDPEPDDLALLTYTSGTTGPPKGAMNTHGNYAFDSQVFRDWIGIGGDDVILGMAPLFHITGLVGHVGLSLSAGAPLVLAHRFEPAETCRLIERHRATMSVAAITAYMALARDEAASRHDLSSLRAAYSGGAPIPPAVVEDVEARTGIVLRSAYGLTETTSASHLTPLGRRPPTDAETGALAVGVPVFDTTMRILDEDDRPLGPGEVGEVAISGPQVVPGYWERPEETAHAIRDGELRTGDVGKVDEDGWLYVVDRKKDMIVAAGFKVWPREVEDVLHEHPAVAEAAVVGAPDEYRGETVHAFVSLEEGRAAEPEELVAFCRERLAAYKCPRRVRIVDEIPKTASGKVLRRELREGAVSTSPGRRRR